jgi:hypothetical protein
MTSDFDGEERVRTIAAVATHLAALAEEAKSRTETAANAIFAASTPEALSAAVRNMHEILTDEAAVWGKLAATTRQWHSRADG